MTAPADDAAKPPNPARKASVTTQSLESMLCELHSYIGIHDGWLPSAPTADLPGGLGDTRRDLLDEELTEYAEALAAGDIVKIADAIADLIYVLGGDAVVHGLPLDAVLAEVHRSNMTKISAPKRPKLVKGQGYRPPDIARVLSGQKRPCPEGVVTEQPAGRGAARPADMG